MICYKCVVNLTQVWGYITEATFSIKIGIAPYWECHYTGTSFAGVPVHSHTRTLYSKFHKCKPLLGPLDLIGLPPALHLHLHRPLDKCQYVPSMTS